MATAKIKSASSKVANAFNHPTIVTQKNKRISPDSSAGSSPTITKTPKTPADEGIDFFESAIRHGEAPIRVYELPLEPDGGPSKSREVRLDSNPSIVTATLTTFIQYICLPPADVPYILRVSLEAGTPASRNGVFKTNFPLEGGVFDRNKFVDRKYVDIMLSILVVDQQVRLQTSHERL